jgi:hypothetical protein
MAAKQYNALCGMPNALLNGMTTTINRVPVSNAPIPSVKNTFFGFDINFSINVLTSFGILCIPRWFIFCNIPPI